MFEAPAWRTLSGGLTLRPPDWRAAGIAVACAIMGVTASILVLDGLLFRQHLTPDYVRVFTSPLIPRLPVLSLIAALEEVKYRLLLMTTVVALQKLIFGRLSVSSFVAAIVISQFVNVGSLVLADPVYAALRYWAVGCVWGWLYWKHGWLAAMTGHAGSHLLLNPLLMQVLLHS